MTRPLVSEARNIFELLKFESNPKAEHWNKVVECVAAVKWPCAACECHIQIRLNAKTMASESIGKQLSVVLHVLLLVSVLISSGKSFTAPALCRFHSNNFIEHSVALDGAISLETF